jgi:hypothetical protein
MKKKFIWRGLMAAAIFGACRPESPAMFSQKASLYFGTPNLYNTAFTSATQFSFATYPHKTVDTLMVPVSLLGSTSPKDRQFTVATLDTSVANAMEGTDYQLLNPYVLPANATSVNIPVLLYRSSALDSIAINFFLKTVPNQDFAPSNYNQSVYNIGVNYLQKPANWDVSSSGVTGWAKYQNNFGSWTKTKYLLILNALYNSVSDTTTSTFPYNYLQPAPVCTQYLQIVKNYILTNYPGNYSGTGPKLLDPDANNLPVQVGPANY